jgi:exosortase A-associated hydrolase 1
MSRRHLAFPCAGETLAGTLDDAPGTSGLLLVSGGNEIRAGAFAGQAQLAARVASAGFPVFRFDHRGVGDSSGENRGFRDRGGDVTAALAAFRRECPRLARVIGFGNCDAASALMLGAGLGCDALVLANPWTIEDDDSAPPSAAIRERYAAKLRDPRELARLVTGKVSLRKLAGGLGRALRPAAPPTSLALAMTAGLARFAGPVDILLAERDRTAQAFLAAWDPTDPRIDGCRGASHAFVQPEAREWLFGRIVAALEAAA